MSIINDALKRAQKNMAKTETKDTKKDPSKDQPAEKPVAKGPVYPTPKAAPSAPPPPPKSDSKKVEDKTDEKKKKIWLRTLAVIVAIFFLITGILMATLFFLKKRSTDSSDPTNIRRNYQPRQITRTYKEGELVLSGISLIENKRVAIINGDIYEEGDIVDGNQIINIELHRVILKDTSGKVIHLKTKKAN